MRFVDPDSTDVIRSEVVLLFGLGCTSHGWMSCVWIVSATAALSAGG